MTITASLDRLLDATKDVQNLPRTTAAATPTSQASAADLPGGQCVPDTHPVCAAGSLPGDHPPTDAQPPCVAGSLPAAQSSGDSQSPFGGGSPALAIHGLHPHGSQFVVAVDGELLFYAALLDDIEDLRKRSASRVRSLGAEGVPTTAYEQTLDALDAMEHQAVLNLQRAVRRNPYGPWVKATTGIGEKQGARLLAAIGDPYWNAAENRPRRGPAELWAYCGYAPEQRRKKGVKSNWNADAKMRAFLCAEACVKAGVRKTADVDDQHGYDVDHRLAITPYGETYLAARASWADRDTTDLHKHNHAMRLVAKEILKDLWRHGHHLAAGNLLPDAQSHHARGENPSGGAA